MRKFVYIYIYICEKELGWVQGRDARSDLHATIVELPWSMIVSTRRTLPGGRLRCSKDFRRFDAPRITRPTSSQTSSNPGACPSGCYLWHAFPQWWFFRQFLASANYSPSAPQVACLLDSCMAFGWSYSWRCRSCQVLLSSVCQRSLSYHLAFPGSLDRLHRQHFDLLHLSRLVQAVFLLACWLLTACCIFLVTLLRSSQTFWNWHLAFFIGISSMPSTVLTVLLFK